MSTVIVFISVIFSLSMQTIGVLSDTELERLLDRGYMYIQMEEWDKAINEYTAALKLDPKNVDALLYLACCWRQLGRTEKAIDGFSAAIALDPKRADAYYLRANTRIDVGQFSKAIEDATKSIRLDSKDFQAFTVRGRAYIQTAQYDDALQDLNTALKLNTKDSNIYRFRALVWMRKNDYDKALDDIAEAVKLNPKDFEAQCYRVFCLLVQKGVQAAQWEADALVRQFPQSAIAYYYRGTFSWMITEWENSLRDFDRAIQLDSKHADSYAMRATLRATCDDRTIRDPQKALADAKKSKELQDMTSWKSPIVFEGLAVAYAANGDFEQAVKWQKLAIANPDYVGAARRDQSREWLKLFEEKKSVVLKKMKP